MRTIKGKQFQNQKAIKSYVHNYRSIDQYLYKTLKSLIEKFGLIDKRLSLCTVPINYTINI